MLTSLNNAGSGYTYHADSALKTLEHNLVEPQGTVTDARYDFDYNAVNQITDRTISNNQYVFKAGLDDVNKHYTSNGLNQYDCLSDVANDTGCLSGTSLTYDDSGNLTSDGIRTYEYDVENRLITVAKPNLTVTYEYGPKGRRFASVSSLSGRKEYLYEGDEPIADYKMNGSNQYLLMRFLHGAGVDERLAI